MWVNHGYGIPHRCVLTDILYGEMPVLWPEGRQWSHVYPGGQVKQCGLTVHYTDPLLKEAIPFAKRAADWHRLVGLEEMVSHQFFDDVGLVQETVFGNGRRAIVNFSSEQFAASPGMVIEPESAITM